MDNLKLDAYVETDGHSPILDSEHGKDNTPRYAYHWILPAITGARNDFDNQKNPQLHGAARSFEGRTGT